MISFVGLHSPFSLEEEFISVDHLQLPDLPQLGLLLDRIRTVPLQVVALYQVPNVPLELLRHPLRYRLRIFVTHFIKWALPCCTQELGFC